MSLPYIISPKAIARLAEFAAPLAPPLAAVAFITDAHTREGAGRIAEKLLIRAGYRVRPRMVKNSAAASLQDARSLNICEDVQLLIGAGGEETAELVKYAAARRRLPCAFIAVNPSCVRLLPSSAALIDSAGIEKTYSTPPFAFVLCDTDFLSAAPKNACAAAFGAVVSKCVSLFDYRVSGILNKERFCAQRSARGYAVIDELLTRLAPPFNFSSAAPLLAEASLAFSHLVREAGNARLLNGGEVQAAHVLRLLFLYEQRHFRQRGENEFLCASAVAGIYQNLLAAPPAFFAPPPDNNARLKQIVQYLGIAEADASVCMRPVPAPQDLKIAAYRLKEYRAELYTEARALVSRLARARTVFKRLYADDGYALQEYLDPPDIALAVALAPDLKEKYTLLSYMKDAGLLESL
ncbi:MAG: iron-containing alcohol dehydrogenase [Firmicutes bacterium]|nr:iron-containing alcohol dehydrogenase [Bacillota bacterium]